MSFRVEPGAIDGFSKLVARAADGSTQAVAFTGNAQIDTALGGAAWDMVAGDHDRYVSEAKKALQKAQRVLDSSARELAKSATYYRETDRGEASKLDATYPGSKGAGSPPEGGSAGDFSDTSSAADLLKMPSESKNPLVQFGQGHVDEYNMNPVQKTLGSILDLGSPSAMAVEASKLLFGFDPFGEMNNWILGDWNKYNDCADVWGGLGGFCDAVAANLRKGTGNVALTWNGNASDAARVYFDEFAGKLTDFKDTFDSLRTSYKQAAQLAFQFAEFLKSFMVALCDALVTWLVNLAAAQAANLIPVGGQVASAAMFALAAAQALRIMKMWSDAAGSFNQLQMALTTLGLAMSAAVNGFSAADGFPEVAASGYDHQAV
ncbi:WXG100 family type VII secretion target [Streptomyces chryseus]|uniref:WXG100 family type VII secretion target n=1 Tax=Streptomyces chryseus TaxID=68186 RepID=UPI0019AF19A2|nr:hypothetical protein [Streptomyces chryseus]GGW96160.1 hypothetical protein GCM10010353_09250 [Streptomyces chryseus]